MPLPLVVGAVGAVVLTVLGVTFLGWRVYGQVGAGPVSVGGGVAGPGAGPAPQGAASSWVPLALVGLGALVILRR